jgi:hypothetical protein
VWVIWLSRVVVVPVDEPVRYFLDGDRFFWPRRRDRPGDAVGVGDAKREEHGDRLLKRARYYWPLLADKTLFAICQRQAYLLRRLN